MPEEKPSSPQEYTWFDSLLARAEGSASLAYNSVLLIIIVASSTLLTLVLVVLGINVLKVDPAEDILLVSFWVAFIVSVTVGMPAVMFGSAMLTRLKGARDDLRGALTQTSVANRAKTEFLANMSHEIRTPLNGVLGMAQILEQSEMTPDQTESLRMIGESGKLLMAIINDVLDLSKIEAGQISIDPRPDQLAPLILNTVELFRARAHENDTELVFSCDPDLPAQVVYDSVRTRQCVANLVSNAVKFTRGGRVTVHLSAVEEDGDWRLSIAVRDSGIGIEQATLKRLFQPFEQADVSTSREYGGTGLGLALSRRFARLMGGDITVTSTPGEGSCFTLTLRAAKVGLLDDSPQGSAGTAHDLSWLEGQRILVVDDSQINRKVVQGLLRPFGPICLEAENGAEALRLLDREAVDLVLLDMHMPVMDGRTMLAELRKRPGPEAALPVIALTAELIQSRRDDFVALGCQGFLAKPLRRAELEAELVQAQAQAQRPLVSEGGVPDGSGLHR